MLDRLRRWFAWETRSVDYADPALKYLYGDARTSSGEPVSLERSVGLTALWSCVSLISGAIGAMPLVLYRRLEDGREKATEHPLFDVLRVRPNPVQSCVAFWEAMVVALLLRGNSYAAIVRDDDARVRGLFYVSPDRVSVEVLKNGRLKYKVNAGGLTTTVDAANMLHVTGPMSDDGYTGRSVISTFRETLGLGLATERYAGEFFSNAATPRGILTAPQALTPKAREQISASIAEAHTAQGKRHRTLVLESGLVWTPIGLNHEDSQLIESRRFTTEEVARIFGVPPVMIGAETKGSMTYSNAETRSLDFLKYCLAPWLARIESAVNFACVSPLERRQLYCEYLPDALLATDTKGRYEAYQLGVAGGWLTVDEIRRKENLPALVERAPTIA
jgi:HK97 family phage portal protein